MESVEALSEGGWSSFSGMFSTEETNFMAQLLGNYPLPNEPEGGLSLGTTSTFWPAHEATLNMVGSDESTYYYSDTVNPSLSCFPLGSSYSSGSSSLCFPNLGPENYYLSHSNPILVANDSSMSMDYSMVDEQNTSLSIQVFPDNLMKEVFPDNLMKEADCLNEELGSDRLQVSGPTLPEAVCSEKKLQSKRKSEMLEPDMATENKIDTNASENPRKKSQVSGDVQRTMKKTQSKKKQKLIHTRNDEEENNAAMNRQSSSGYCSEDDSNASEELNGGGTSSSKGSAALNLNGKTRASRGSATDPQSLYARKRRERINERLRILQNLVPNGTKVDISTMLEEAVQYVNFLQLQIKLLSSDDLWMYAPIAYNGMNLGLDLKISTPQ